MASEDETVEGLVIEVLNEDIQGARRSSCRFCPIARAIQRNLVLEDEHVIVMTKTISIQAEEELLRYLSPPEVQQFVKDFDDGKEVTPFTFTLSERLG